MGATETAGPRKTHRQELHHGFITSGLYVSRCSFYLALAALNDAGIPQLKKGPAANATGPSRLHRVRSRSGKTASHYPSWPQLGGKPGTWVSMPALYRNKLGLGQHALRSQFQLYPVAESRADPLLLQFSESCVSRTLNRLAAVLPGNIDSISVAHESTME
jgi:hypothetical protein